MLLAHVESANCPVAAYQGLKITTSLSYVSMIFSERMLLKHLTRRLLYAGIQLLNSPRVAHYITDLILQKIQTLLSQSVTTTPETVKSPMYNDLIIAVTAAQ
ncbi:hypothetical protein [Bathymodiolus japonicus methanotrophic gill symbiont]|uniref:hypothetical protein n=1 Tax=Bathymodiolus japonicus methanotrophic gill symbiont TaxID=113269 RepID=UPI001C8DEAE7|nr:hypothetical protein [Bathymodiolus japonicus methanotrophic gill symbiont]